MQSKAAKTNDSTEMHVGADGSIISVGSKSIQGLFNPQLKPLFDEYKAKSDSYRKLIQRVLELTKRLDASPPRDDVPATAPSTEILLKKLENDYQALMTYRTVEAEHRILGGKLKEIAERREALDKEAEKLKQQRMALAEKITGKPPVFDDTKEELVEAVRVATDVEVNNRSKAWSRELETAQAEARNLEKRLDDIANQLSAGAGSVDLGAVMLRIGPSKGGEDDAKPKKQSKKSGSNAKKRDDDDADVSGSAV